MARLLRPLFAVPFPGRWRVFGALINNANAQERWKGAGIEWARSRVNGFEMPCDLATFSGRIAWYFRRWYELDVQSVILSLLPFGGVFVDIGGNVGMATLTAAKAAGRNGTIVAFEPNPDVAAIFQASLDRNKLSDVKLHNFAIGKAAGESNFFVPDDNHGEGSFGVDFGQRSGRLITVRVQDGKAIQDLARIDMIKIDVEGFEVTVLEAIKAAIDHTRPLIVCEVSAEHLKRTNHTLDDFFDIVDQLRYDVFQISLENAGLLKQRATIVRTERNGGDAICNALMVPREKTDHIAKTDFVALPK